MVTGGDETILGVRRDPVFGPIVVFGFGGIFVEALKDVTFRAAPSDEGEARAMIKEIAAFPVLTGLRGQPSADLDSLATALSRSTPSSSPAPLPIPGFPPATPTPLAPAHPAWAWPIAGRISPLPNSAYCGRGATKIPLSCRRVGCYVVRVSGRERPS